MKRKANGRYPNGVPVKFLFNVKLMKRDMKNMGITVPQLEAMVCANVFNGEHEQIDKQTIWNFLAGRWQTDKTNGKLARALHRRPSRYVLEAEE